MAQTREIVDALLLSTQALPNAANVVNSNVIDLGTATPFPSTERFAVRITTPATNVGCNSKNINFWLRESADNSNWANIGVFSTSMLKVTDNANAGFAAGSVDVYLAPTAKRYLKASAQGEANGGDASTFSWTVELLF